MAEDCDERVGDLGERETEERPSCRSTVTVVRIVDVRSTEARLDSAAPPLDSNMIDSKTKPARTVEGRLAMCCQRSERRNLERARREQVHAPLGMFHGALISH